MNIAANQVRQANAVKHMVLVNGIAVCKQCAMVSYKKVSAEYRPLVSEWLVYEEVRCHQLEKCSVCGE